jgi:hypothetical protein
MKKKKLKIKNLKLVVGFGRKQQLYATQTNERWLVGKTRYKRVPRWAWWVKGRVGGLFKPSPVAVQEFLYTLKGIKKTKNSEKSC